MLSRYGVLLITSLLIISLLGTFSIYQVNSYPLPSENVNGALPGFKQIGSLPYNSYITFTIYIQPRNLNLLYYYAEQVSNPSSPLYHKFLTKSQEQAIFYPTQRYEQILSIISSEHLNVISTAADSVIMVSGKVSSFKEYFHGSVYLYSNGSATYYFGIGRTEFPDVFVIASNVSGILFKHPTTLITEKEILNFEKTVLQNQTFPASAYWGTALTKVYNLTYLFNKGFMGQGKGIGILDFFGDPYIVQQLHYYDKLTGLPNPRVFNITPIGVYNPELGVVEGWAGEISLDVEISHTMAPKASINLYIASGSTPLPLAIATVDQQDYVQVLSQSFSTDESIYPELPSQLFYQCVYFSDIYYALGSAEGITFLAASGDAGGSGYSFGPLGTVGYPDTSPFVTSVGGTTTYIQFPNGSFYQTAWSNYGFVPNFVNYGGSTGGVSVIEPKPYYQFAITTPPSYPYGRSDPDISANADIFPGIFIVCPGNITSVSGGTSEASPLTAGLLVTIMSYVNTSFGMLNPLLYQIGDNASLYPHVFEPITFGYNIPWTDSYGYNLVNGWGAINAGELASYVLTTQSHSLTIEVAATNSTGQIPFQFLPGETMYVQANISVNGIPVISGKFYATLESTEGNLTTVAMEYVPSLHEWVANIIVPLNDTGITDVLVYGSSSGESGIGMFETFSGYYSQFINPTPLTEIVSQLGNQVVIVNISTVTGVQPLPTFSPSIGVFSYNITTNTYTQITTIPLTAVPASTIIPGTPGLLWVGEIPTNIPVGDIMLMGNSIFGYENLVNGVDLQSLFILPQVVAEPGSVYPGGNITIVGTLTPPPSLTQLSLSTGLPLASAVQMGSNLTAELVSSNGKVVAKNVINVLSSGEYYGQLEVPISASPGLYDVLLFSSYNSSTLGMEINGFFYGQIYVSSGPLSVQSSLSTFYPYQGEKVLIMANITYPNGTEVKYGIFSATILPKVDLFNYSGISQYVEVPLWFNQSLNEWVGNFTTPSPFSASSLSIYAKPYEFAGPYKVLISGISALGYSTPTSLRNSMTFDVQPYSIISSERIGEIPVTSGIFFLNDTIQFNGTLTNDVFLNTTVNASRLVIENSNVSSLVIRNSDVSITGGSGNLIVAYNSTLDLSNTILNNVVLINSKIEMVNSHVKELSPSKPNITITYPNNVTYQLPVNITILGTDVSNVSVYFDGKLITSYPTNGSYSLQISTDGLPDGTYQLVVYVTQADGITVHKVVEVNVEDQLASENSRITSIEGQLSANVTQLTNSLNSAKTQLANQARQDFYITLGLSVIALIIAVVGIVFALRRK
ncbi:peptidase S53 [Sulfolobales archaeon HS-7]|nr:peptidase S53 [Sulfolobales archaeon HS-7]